MKKNKTKKKYYELFIKDEIAELIANEPLILDNAIHYDNFLYDNKSFKNVKKIIIDLKNVVQYDSYLVLFLNSVRKYCENIGLEIEIRNITTEMEGLIKAFSPKTITEEQTKEDKSYFFNYFSNIGLTIKYIINDFYKFIEFIGDLLIKILNLFIHPTQMRWEDFPFHFMRAGANAVPIVVLIMFLIGITTGYQGALMLKQFGGDILIADVIGISITRELGPLMTAILVAGRSGSAFAAEIGTMKVSEEIDALISMGFDPTKFLILPRVIAVVFAIPLLTLIADFAGIAGGLISALLTLNITIAGFINELQSALNYYAVFTGVGKSLFFGFFIASVGCFRGLQVRGGAESIGKYTTASVVSGIFLIILTDAIFAFIFQALKI